MNIRLGSAKPYYRLRDSVMGRSRSSSSSSSSSSSVKSDGSTDGFSKLKKTKKSKDETKKKHKTEGAHLPPPLEALGLGHTPHIAPPAYHAYHADHHASHMYIGEHDGAFAFPYPHPHARVPEIPIPHGGPAASVSGAVGGIIPPQGRRFQTRTEAPFPPVSEVGPAPFADYGGAPVWVGSAIFEDSVHPCKIVPTLEPCCRVPYGGGEYEHRGRYVTPHNPIKICSCPGA